MIVIKLLNGQKRNKTTKQKQKMFVTLDNFDKEKIVVDKTEFKEIRDAKYYDVFLKYDYGTHKNRFSMEFPLMTSKGIFKKEQDRVVDGVNQKITKYAMLFTFENDNEDDKLIIQALNDIYAKTRKLLASVRGQTGIYLKGFKEEDPECTKYQSFVKYKLDEKTGEIIPGSTPAIWVKLYQFGETRGSHFYDLNSSEVEWELLENVEIKMCPLIDFSKLYVSQKAIYMQYFVSSGVITEIKSLTSKNRQESTIESMAEKYKEKVSDLEIQLAKMREDHKEELERLKGTNNINSVEYNENPRMSSTSGLTDFLNEEGTMSISTPRNIEQQIPKINKYM